MASIIQDWVAALGLRHQGTLMTGIRGCDTVPKDDPSKAFVRCYRAVVLVAHCGDAAKARTFIEAVGDVELEERFLAFRKSTDHLPSHYVFHLFHCIEIVGYKHPDPYVRRLWGGFYKDLCRAMHVTPETEAELDERLNADEETFAARDFTCDGTPKPCGNQAYTGMKFTALQAVEAINGGMNRDEVLLRLLYPHERDDVLRMVAHGKPKKPGPGISYTKDEAVVAIRHGYSQEMVLMRLKVPVVRQEVLDALNMPRADGTDRCASLGEKP